MHRFVSVAIYQLTLECVKNEICTGAVEGPADQAGGLHPHERPQFPVARSHSASFSGVQKDSTTYDSTRIYVDLVGPYLYPPNGRRQRYI